MTLSVKTVHLNEAAQKIVSIIGTTGTRAVARNIAEGARAKWIDLASKELSSSRMEYIQGIQPVEQETSGNQTTMSVTLVGALPNMVEQGASSFSLHKTLLGPDAEGVKTAKDGGRYRAIPFRHKTPTAGHTGGQPMGSQFRPRGPMSMAAPHEVVEDSVKLGRKIHRQAKKLKKGKRLKEGLAPKLRPHHTTDIFAGMKVNLQPVSGGRFQRTYSTFRMISVDKTGQPRPAGKWQHPGITARNFVDQVSTYVDEIAPKAFEAYVNGVLTA